MSSLLAQLCVIYVRVSSAKQMTEGDGLRSQEKRCRDYAESRGYTVLRVFADGITGAVEDRRAMNEMLAFLEEQAGEVIVIVDDLKRFARDVITHFDLKAEIYARGGRMESPLFRFEDTPEGRFVETVTAAQAELERNQNRRQVLNRMKARLEQGYWTFQPPAGYHFIHDPVHKKIMVPDERRAPLVKEALEGFAAGRFGSVSEVYRFLAAAGFFASQRSADPTRHLMLVHRMLRQILYTGHLEYRPWGISLRPAVHPAFITLTDYHRIQERLAGRARPILRKDTAADFPLRGIIHCATCGRALTASWSRGKRQRFAYYHCCNRGCPLYGKTVPKAQLEAEYEVLLKRLIVNDTVIDLARRELQDAWEQSQQRQEDAAARFRKRLKEIEEEVGALAGRLALTKSETVATALEQRIEQLEYERLETQQKMRLSNNPQFDVGTLFTSVRFLLENPYQTWKEGDLPRKRLVSRLVFSGALPYRKNEGFGTPDIGLPYRLLQRIGEQKCTMVDPALKSSSSPEETPAEQALWQQCIETLRQWQTVLNSCDGTMQPAPSHDLDVG